MLYGSYVHAYLMSLFGSMRRSSNQIESLTACRVLVLPALDQWWPRATAIDVIPPRQLGGLGVCGSQAVWLSVSKPPAFAP